jgi:hypothetical protein
VPDSVTDSTPVRPDKEDFRMTSMRTTAGSLALLAALALAAGCGRSQPEPKGGQDSSAAADTRGKGGKEEDHSQGAGPHGGAVADWGGGKYHIEFTVSHPKQEARVYTLGADGKKPAPIKAKDGQLLLTIRGVKEADKEAFQVVLKADPQKGDPEGTASCFAGKHERLGKEQELQGTGSGEVGGKRYVGDFKEEPEAAKK